MQIYFNTIFLQLPPINQTFPFQLPEKNRIIMFLIFGGQTGSKRWQALISVSLMVTSIVLAISMDFWVKFSFGSSCMPEILRFSLREYCSIGIHSHSRFESLNTDFLLISSLVWSTIGKAHYKKQHLYDRYSIQGLWGKIWEFAFLSKYILQLYDTIIVSCTNNLVRFINCCGQLSKRYSMGWIGWINHFLPNGLCHPYELDVHFQFRGVWCTSFISIIFRIKIPISKQC